MTSPATQAAPERAAPPGLAALLAEPGAMELVVQMAHDLKSPLSSILVLAETMLQGQSGRVTDLQRHQLGLIYSAALSLATTASDVTELARGGNRLMDGGPAPLSVSEILYTVHDTVRPIAEDKGLELRVAPPLLDRRSGHARALSRVLLNLVTNALKFTTEGYVRVSAEEPGPSPELVEFSVSDTGPGLDAPSLSTLCQPFRAESGGRRFFSGTGLGLAICRKLVSAMGSSLQVDAAAGRGTRFFFTLELPLAE